MALKLTLVLSAFPKLSETFFVNKFLGLVERGYDVHVVCGQSHALEWERFSQLRTRLDLRRRVHVAWPHRPRWLAVLLMPAAFVWCLLTNPVGTWRYLSRGWKRFGVDVLRRLYLAAGIIRTSPDLIHFEFGALAVSQMYLRELLDCKVLVSFRGYELNFVELEKPDYYQEVWEHSDALHFLGEDLWLQAQRRGCPPDKPHALIPPAIETDFFSLDGRSTPRTIGTQHRPLRLLSVGRLHWKKGYEYVLQAVRLLADQGIVLEYRIIGTGDHRQALVFCRQDLGLEHSVFLLGDLPREDVRDQMVWADIFVHSAVSEGFCNSVIEAQAMELPVVCTDADGLPENVLDGSSGFVVPRRDPKALAEKVTLLTQNFDLREQMGRAGRKRVLTHFRLTDQISAFGSLYRNIVS